MNKTVKIILRVVVSVISLAIVLVLGLALYFNASIINIEKKE